MESDIQFNHSITLNERKNLLVTGVKKIDHFDTNEFLIETNMGYLFIKGSELELIKLDTFKGNVNFSNCKQIQEEYGLDYNIDVSITTDYNLLKINDIIKYREIIYNVTDILSSDSHLLVVATKWRQ